MALLKRIYISTLIVIFTFLYFALTNQAYGKGTSLKGFSKIPFLEEQILAFNYSPDINVEINAPAADKFDDAKRTSIIFYALPNSNSIEQTIGRQKKEGLDWHFDIQHIGAQTRFLREQIKDRNIVVVYVGTKEESWPWWKSKHANGDSVIKSLVDTVKGIFAAFKTEIILDGHSGGGSFVLGYINSVKKIPDYVKRISFLDSEYDYSTELMHGSKIINWLKSGYDHFLCAIAYDDRGIKINGQDIGTLNGGTFYRTGLMVDDLSKAFNMSKTEDSLFTKYYGLNGRIKIFLKSNPGHQMWHTLLVEKNGFIETILSGTLQEEKNYQFWGWRAYSQYIQP
ncbi:MAG: hypothetical protein P4L45_14605 [Ignavibacteriaceae bacterium]|nr:hypothetical protein [Ignavibacteriaceae bacterium]